MNFLKKHELGLNCNRCTAEVQRKCGYGCPGNHSSALPLFYYLLVSYFGVVLRRNKGKNMNKV